MRIEMWFACPVYSEQCWRVPSCLHWLLAVRQLSRESRRVLRQNVNMCAHGRCMAVILARLRQLPGFWDAQRSSHWERATRQLVQTGHPDVGPLDDLEDKEVLIIGHGSIGKALEKRLLPFGAHVSRIARTAREGVHSMSGDIPLQSLTFPGMQLP